ncbi:MAG: hypothetical protein ACPGWR_05575 [Ardenticatenaceae bacterium]
MVHLNLIRQVVSGSKLPYLPFLCDMAGKALVPTGSIVKGHVGQYQMSFDFTDLIQRRMYFGVYEQPDTQLLQKVLRPGDIFLDIGANVGYYSLVASQLVGDEG